MKKCNETWPAGWNTPKKYIWTYIHDTCQDTCWRSLLLKHAPETWQVARNAGWQILQATKSQRWWLAGWWCHCLHCELWQWKCHLKQLKAPPTPTHRLILKSYPSNGKGGDKEKNNKGTTVYGIIITTMVIFMVLYLTDKGEHTKINKNVSIKTSKIMIIQS